MFNDTIIVDLTEQAQETLRCHPMSALLTLPPKFGRSKHLLDDLQAADFAGVIAHHMARGKPTNLQSVVHYLLAVTAESERQALLQDIVQRFPMMEDPMRSVLDVIQEEGKAEGKAEMAQRIATSLLKLNALSMQAIADITQLPLKTVRKLKGVLAESK